MSELTLCQRELCKNPSLGYEFDSGPAFETRNFFCKQLIEEMIGRGEDVNFSDCPLAASTAKYSLQDAEKSGEFDAAS